MGRTCVLLVTVLIIAVVLLGCTDQRNSVLKNLGIEVNDKAIAAVIVNNPSEVDLRKVPQLARYDCEMGEEYLLILPVLNWSAIEIISLIWQDDRLQHHEVLYKVDKTKDGYALLLRAARPCGIPWLKVRISNKSGHLEYLVAEDGLHGTPAVEYLEWWP